MLPVMILAGGLATRLRPLTETIPKALIEVAGKPFILWQLDYLRSQGIKRVILCTGYLSQMIEDVVGDGSLFDLDISYSPDGDQLRGTGGAIKNALHLINEDNFFVLYGDSFLPINFMDIESYFSENGAFPLMTVINNDNQWDKSNAIFHDGKVVLYDKNNDNQGMHYIDYGLGVLNKGIFTNFQVGENFDLAVIYNQLSQDNHLNGYEVFTRFYEIGTLEGIKQTEVFLNENRNELFKKTPD